MWHIEPNYKITINLHKFANRIPILNDISEGKTAQEVDISK